MVDNKPFISLCSVILNKAKNLILNLVKTLHFVQDDKQSMKNRMVDSKPFIPLCSVILSKRRI